MKTDRLTRILIVLVTAIVTSVCVSQFIHRHNDDGLHAVARNHDTHGTARFTSTSSMRPGF